MPLQDAVIPVDFGLGLDQKKDPKQVQGNLLMLQDGVITKAGQVAKRNGYSLLLSEQSLLTKAFANQLLTADGASVYSYSSDNQTNTKIGSYQSVSVTPQNIPVLNSEAYDIRSAILTYNGANYVCCTYAVYNSANATETLYVNVTNNDTGVVVLTDTILASLAANSVAVAIPFAVNTGGTPSFGLVINDLGSGGGGNSILYTTIAAPFTSAPAAPTTLVSGAVLTVAPLGSSSTTSYLGYVSFSGTTATVNVCTIVGTAITGTVTAGTFTYTSGSGMNSTIGYDAAGNIWLAASCAGIITTSVVSTSLAIVGATRVASSYTSTTVSANLDPASLALSAQGGTNMKLYFSRIVVTSAALGNYRSIYVPSDASDQANSTTVVTDVVVCTPTTSNLAELFLENVQVQSNFVAVTGAGASGGNVAVFANLYPFTNVYLTLAASNANRIGAQTTFFLINESTASVIGKCLSGAATSRYTDDMILCYQANGNVGSSNLALTVMGNIVYFGAPCIIFAENSAIYENGLTFNSVIPTNENGLKMEAFNFNDLQAYQTQVFQNTLVFNGACLKMYDGSNFAECGFNLYPEIANIVYSQSAGDIQNGQYQYAFTYTWLDNNGQQWESAPTLIEINVSPGSSVDQEMTFYILSLGVTDKLANASGRTLPPVYINMYRTDPNGTTLYFLQSVPNNPNAATTQITDGFGAELAGQPEIYTTGNVLNNDAPPAAMLLTVRADRLYAVDSENPVTDYWYTKSQNKGFGICFSGFLVETIDAVGGLITSQAQMDEKLVTFKETGLGFQYGDGPNDTGNPASSTLTNFQFVPSDTSSNNHRATIIIPNGCMFQSPKGLYMLNRGLQVQYIGNPIQNYNSQFYTTATMLESSTAVRFLAQSGMTVVYNYFFNQWYVFSNHTGTSADIYNDLYTYSRNDGTVYQENKTSFLDNTTPYSLIAQIAWMKLSGIQGFERVKQAFLLGDQLSPATGHGIQMSAAYDYGTSFSTPVGYTFNNASGAFQYREFLAQQKCMSLTILIQEVTTGASGEFVDFTNLSFYAAMKKGPNKLPAASSVG